MAGLGCPEGERRVMLCLWMYLWASWCCVSVGSHCKRHGQSNSSCSLKADNPLRNAMDCLQENIYRHLCAQLCYRFAEVFFCLRSLEITVCSFFVFVLILSSFLVSGWCWSHKVRWEVFLLSVDKISHVDKYYRRDQFLEEIVFNWC